MPDFHAEQALLFFLLLNAAVFGSALVFASVCMTRYRSQALLDAVLLTCAVQYVSVGLPGMIGWMRMPAITATAVALSAVLLIASGPTAGRASARRWRARRAEARPAAGNRSGVPRPILKCLPNPRLLIPATAIFVTTFVVAFAHSQAYVPVSSNDALTYHFPAAVQWLQQGRIELFQTWFFNPANTYSPLAGSLLIVWLIAPFGNDVLARFVEVPALLCIGLALYRLCRVLGVRGSVASLIAAAGIVSRPIFLPCMMGKDDLFVAFFFIAALVALCPPDRRAIARGLRLGIALGLLLATKYTALLCIPILLPAIPLRRRASVPRSTGVPPVVMGGTPMLRSALIAIATASLLAGPWYLRNLLLTGNPLFPIRIFHLLPGLFTTVRSDEFRSFNAALAVLIGDSYNLPIPLAIVLGTAWVASICVAVRQREFRPALRAAVLGPPLGIAIFLLLSPFPEVRFVLPEFLLLFACGGVAIDRFLRGDIAAMAVSTTILALSLGTVFKPAFWQITVGFCLSAIAVTGVAMLTAWWAGRRRQRWLLAASAAAVLGFIFIYINWAAYDIDHANEKFYDIEYPQLNPLWQFVNEQLPADATLAYTNLYLIYPLQGPSLHRRLVYLPVRAGVNSIADLGWLGDHLSGERLITAANRVTVASPDRAAWLAKIARSGARYLVIGNGGTTVNPPEARFAGMDPQRFKLLYAGDGGWVYRIE